MPARLTCDNGWHSEHESISCLENARAQARWSLQLLKFQLAPLCRPRCCCVEAAARVRQPRCSCRVSASAEVVLPLQNVPATPLVPNTPSPLRRCHRRRFGAHIGVLAIIAASDYLDGRHNFSRSALLMGTATSPEFAGHLRFPSCACLSSCSRERSWCLWGVSQAPGGVSQTTLGGSYACCLELCRRMCVRRYSCVVQQARNSEYVQNYALQ
jgi:hypothetical protein